MLIPDVLRRVLAFTANGDLKTKTIGSQATRYSYDAFGNLRQVSPLTGSCKSTTPGIDDAWLSIAEKHFTDVPWGGKAFESAIAIAMDSAEVAYLNAVRSLVPSLQAVCGPRCDDILRKGMKIEIEPLLDPALYNDSYPEALLHHFATATSGGGAAKPAEGRRQLLKARKS